MVQLQHDVAPEYHSIDKGRSGYDVGQSLHLCYNGMS